MKFVFAPYEPEAPLGPHDIPSNAVYITLRRAVETSTVPATTRADLLTAVELQKKLLAIAEELTVPVFNAQLGKTVDERGYRLPPAGATLDLTPAEHAMLQDDWQAHAKQHGRGAAALLLAISDFLSSPVDA